jgi:hypothetical protein
VLRYLQGTIDYGLRYASSVDMRLQGYADADWAGSVVDLKSTSGCCLNLGSAMVSRCSRKQELCGFEYHRSKVHSVMCGSSRSSVASQAPCRLIWT